jgi:hypothetical protein
MSITSCTLRISGSAQKGYVLSFSGGPPGTTEDIRVQIPGEAFATNSIDTKSIIQTLSDPRSRLEDLKEIGSKLVEILLLGEVGQHWGELQTQTLSDYNSWRQNASHSPDDEPVLRTFLRIEPFELQHLPWETCWRKSRGVFFHRAFPVVRIWAKKLDERIHPHKGPIRILAVIGSGDAELGAADEVFEIWRSLRDFDHSFDVDIFDCQLVEEGQDPIQMLKDRLRTFQPHVFHFAGHAYYEDPGLQLKPAKGTSRSWASDDISSFFSNETWGLRLVYLNACRTSQKPANKQDSLVAAFEDAGTLSCLTMLGNIAGKEAGASASSFYKSLASGLQIDRALAKARADLGVEQRGAYYPVWTTRVDPDSIICFRSEVSDARQAELLPYGQRDEISLFVNRGEARRLVVDALEADERSSRRFAYAVYGNVQHGKSWFLKWCLRTLAWHNHPVIYTRLQDFKKWRDLLQSWTRGGSDPILRHALSAVAVGRLEPVLGGKDDLENSGMLPQAAEKVLAELRSTVADKPLVLAVDHFQPSDVGESLALDATNFIQYIFNPIAKGDGKLRLVVTSGSETLFQKQDLEGNFGYVSLGLFPPGCRQHLREWFMAKDPKNWRKAEQYINIGLQTQVTPKAFSDFCVAIYNTL